MSARPEARRRIVLAPLPPDDDQTGWLVTFSDLVLQLFAFVLVASVLGGRAVAPPPAVEHRAAVEREPEADEAATAKAYRALGERLLAEVPEPVATAPAPAAVPEPAPAPAPEPAPAAPPPALAAAAEALRAFVANTGREDALAVTSGVDDVVLTLDETIGFASGSADLLPGAEPALREIVRLVGTLPDVRIDVVGHTDDVPIHTAQFPSNLELSLARAARVARELAVIDPSVRVRTFAAGFGEQRPVALNDGPAGRARNRRVEVRLVGPGAPPPARPVLGSP
ncbi:MAG: OmpA family protein [Candidatus Binatia bacterium]